MLKSEKGCKTPQFPLVSFVPGSPSQAGSKPGDVCLKASTKQLVASRGLGGSNPPPGAILLVRVVFEFILSKIYIVEFNSN